VDYIDPVYEGPADPTVLRVDDRWLMYHTSRRANVDGLEGVSWVHGTPIGVAASTDGVHWTYTGDAKIGIEGEDLTFWAPEVLVHDGVGHMFLTVVPGIFADWGHERSIVHLTSTDLCTWSDPRPLALASDRVIDACVARLSDGTWRLWYNEERSGKHTHYADSPDLYAWTDRGVATDDQPGEGPNVFCWQGSYWLLTDVWDGLAVYCSGDALTWTRQPGTILADHPKGHHADVVVDGDNAYIYYFVHPDGPRRSGVRRAELAVVDGLLTVPAR
jgi:beta-xylosidase